MPPATKSPSTNQAQTALWRGSGSYRGGFPGICSPGIWAFVGAGVMLLAGHLTVPPWAIGQRQPQEAEFPAASGALWLWMSQRENDPQQLLVAVDRETRHAAVYHIDVTNGTMTLRSTRNLAWDLLVDDFNGREPSPEALKNMLETAAAPH